MATNGTSTVDSNATNQPVSSAGSKGISWEGAQSRLASEIVNGFSEKHPTLIEALPSIGKSYGVIEWAAETGNPLTVFTARHDLYKQYVEWCEEHGLSYYILPSFHYDCETANGSHSKKLATRVKNAYSTKGLFPSEIHDRAEDIFGEPLPCEQNGGCSYPNAKTIDSSEYDVLIGHYRHANVPARSDGRFVVFDEFPEADFLTEYSEDTVKTAVSAFLADYPDLPFQYKRDLREYRRDPVRKEEGRKWFAKNCPGLRRDPARVIRDTTGKHHPDAATLCYAILMATDLDNRWEHTAFPDGRKAVINPGDGPLTVLNPPMIHGAEGVVALDGTPTLTKWKLILGDRLQYRPIMTENEKRAYIRDTMNIDIIQTTPAANPYSSGNSVTPAKDLALLEAINNRENTELNLISSKAALQMYREGGLSELVEKTRYYGLHTGTNEFATTRVGAVFGSTHYSDNYVRKWAALAGASAEVATDDEGNRIQGMNLDFGPVGNHILHSMREHEVLQAILRFGRDRRGARVYVHTAAIPGWVEVSKQFPTIHYWDRPPKKGKRQVITAIQDLEESEWRTKTIEERVSLGSSQTKNTLDFLCEHEFIDYREEGRGFTWFDRNLSEIGEHGHVIWGDAAN